MGVEVAGGVEVGPGRADRAGRVAQEVQPRLLAGADDVVVVAQVPRGVEQRGRADQLQLAAAPLRWARPAGGRAGCACGPGGAVDAQPVGQRRRQHVRGLLGLVARGAHLGQPGLELLLRRAGRGQLVAEQRDLCPQSESARCRRRARPRRYRHAASAGPTCCNQPSSRRTGRPCRPGRRRATPSTGPPPRRGRAGRPSAPSRRSGPRRRRRRPAPSSPPRVRRPTPWCRRCRCCRTGAARGRRRGRSRGTSSPSPSGRARAAAPPTARRG